MITKMTISFFEKHKNTNRYKLCLFCGWSTPTIFSIDYENDTLDRIERFDAVEQGDNGRYYIKNTDTKVYLFYLCGDCFVSIIKKNDSLSDIEKEDTITSVLRTVNNDRNGGYVKGLVEGKTLLHEKEKTHLTYDTQQKIRQKHKHKKFCGIVKRIGSHPAYVLCSRCIFDYTQYKTASEDTSINEEEYCYIALEEMLGMQYGIYDAEQYNTLISMKKEGDTDYIKGVEGMFMLYGNFLNLFMHIEDMQREIAGCEDEAVRKEMSVDLESWKQTYKKWEQDFGFLVFKRRKHFDTSITSMLDFGVGLADIIWE